MRADQVKDHSSPHMKAMLYSNLDGDNNSINDELLQGEILVALRLAHTQMRRRRLHGHMTVPVIPAPILRPSSLLKASKALSVTVLGSSLLLYGTPTCSSH